MPVLQLPPNALSQTSRARALIFEDPLSRALLANIEKVAPSEAAILLCGETGTGKEIIARQIHVLSRRSTGPFLAVNCGAFTENLVESELFGHEKGAFTGAVQAKAGWFESAQGGTLFLDEVGDLPLATQVKLLRVLQENEVVRIGSRQPIPIDVRIVSATNVDLREAMLAGDFREDLFYRLNVVGLSVEPLRNRPDDIVPLASYFTELYKSRLGSGEIELTESACAALRRYVWPGNIRELENAIHHALLICKNGRIEADDLSFGPQPAPASRRYASTPPPAPKATTPELALSALDAALTNLFELGGERLHERVEEALFRSAYRFCEQNQLQTARLLGISRNVVRARLIQFGAIAAGARPTPSVALQSTPTKTPALATSPQESSASRSSQSPRVPESLRVGYQRFGQLLLVRELGDLDSVLKERGVRVDWVEFPAGLELMDALQRGTLDFGVVGECPPVFAQAASAPIVYVACEASAPEGEAILVPADSSIRNVNDLRGKTIALSRGSNAHYLLIRALDEVGLSYDDVDIMFLRPEQAQCAFATGEVDAWGIWDPLMSSVRESIGARILRDGRGLTLNSAYYVARRDVWRQQPELIERVLEKVEEAAHFARAHSSAAARLLGKRGDFHQEALTRWLRKLSGTRRPTPTHVLAQQEIADRLCDLELVVDALQISDLEFWPNLGRPPQRLQELALT